MFHTSFRFCIRFIGFCIAPNNIHVMVRRNVSISSGFSLLCKITGEKE